MTTFLKLWAGKDLSPLAYESDTSCLLRLAWRNAINFTILKQHFSSAKREFLLDRQALEQQVGWKLDDIEQRHLGHATDPRTEYWLADEFRYCPVCLECGFHSDLFQCVAVLVCPFHGVELSACCHCCGHPNPGLSDARRLYDYPYLCDRCIGPIAGVPPMLDAHLDFRASCGEVTAAFKPYYDWFEQISGRRHEVTALRVDRCPGLQAQWCNIDEFLRGVACKGDFALPCVRHSHYPDDQIVCLSWSQRITHEPTAFNFRKWPDDGGRMARLVYRSVLRGLARWIAREHGWTLVRFEREIQAFRVEMADDYPTAFVAYFAFRCQLESPYVPCDGVDLCPPGRAACKDGRFCRLHSYHGRGSRLAWKAALLAVYASWFERIARLDCVSLTILREFAQEDRLHIFLRERLRHRQGERWLDGDSSVADEVRFEGEVSFVRIAGMPMWPWDRHVSV